MTDKIIKKTKKGSYDSQTVFITEYKRKFNNEIVVRYHNFSNGRNYDTLEELLNDPERDRNEYCIFLSRYNTYRETYQHNSTGILCPMKLMKNIRNGAINHSKLRFTRKKGYR
jgi:hypothetical protein